MHKYFHSIATNIFPYAANVSKVVEACLAYGCDMMFYWHESIIQNTSVSTLYQTEIGVRGEGG